MKNPRLVRGFFCLSFGVPSGEWCGRQSRAGSLPHWIFGVHKTPVGASLLAIGATRSICQSNR
ncbi:hypothetical protein C0J56_08965 [Pseudomonas fluorescens]|nr:hypothetical protein C0J56_08965 [Pseudomonas fluorescens]